MLPIPIKDDVPRFSKPTTIYALLIANILLFLAFNTITINDSNLNIKTLFYVGDREISEETIILYLKQGKQIEGLRKEIVMKPLTPYATIYANLVLQQSTMFQKPWTLITHAFLHADFWHLAGNLWFLFVFGRSVEDKVRRRLFLPFYLIGAASGALLFSSLSSPGDSLMKGASGAVFATLGMYLVLFPKARVQLVLFFFFFLHVVTVPALWAVGMYAVYEIALTLLGDSGSNIAHSAHVGGFLSGIALIFIARSAGLIRLPHARAFEFIRPKNIFARPERRRPVYPDAPQPFRTVDVTPSSYDAGIDSDSFDPSSDTHDRDDDDRMSAANTDPSIIASIEAVHLYLDDGQIDRALAVYLDCARTAPACVLRPEHQRRIAGLLAQYGLWKQAVQANEAFIAAYPDHRYAPDCHLTIGEILVSRLGNEKAAVPHLIIAAKSHESPAMRNKARGLLALIRT